MAYFDTTISDATFNETKLVDAGPPDEVIYSSNGAGATVSASEISTYLQAGDFVGIDDGAGGSGAGDVTVASAIDGGGGGYSQLRFENPGSVALQAAVSVGSGTLALDQEGGVTQTAVGAITAGLLVVNIGGGVALTSAVNHVGTLDLIAAGGDIALTNSQTLTFEPTNVGGHALTLTTTAGDLNLSSVTAQAATFAASQGAVNASGPVAVSTSLTVSAAQASTFGGVISGNAAFLTDAGAGTLTLTAANTYGNGTTISAGTLQVGAGGTSGSIMGAVVDNATLEFSRSDANIFTGPISGSGAVKVDGGGTLTLDAHNTFSGGLTVTDSTVSTDHSIDFVTLDALGAPGSLVTLVNGTLNVDRGGASIINDLTIQGAGTLSGQSFTFAGAISGTGDLTYAGTAVTISGEDFRASGATVLASGVTVTATGASSVSSASEIRIGSGAALDLTANSLTYDIGALSDAGTVQATGADPSVAAFLSVDGDSSTTFSGVIADGTAHIGLFRAGSGTLTLTGVNTYTGGTTISGGVLQIGHGGVTGSITGDVTDNATLEFSRSDATTFAGAISGTGTVVVDGGAALTLTGANSFGSVTVTNGSTLVADHPDSTSGIVTDDSLGVGLVTLSGGALSIATGDVALANAIAVEGLGNSLSVAAGVGATTLGGDLTGAGALTVTANGLLALLGHDGGFTGSLTLAHGEIVSEGPAADLTGAALTVTSDAEYGFFGPTSSLASLAGGGTVTNMGALTGVLTLGAGGASGIFSGNLEDGRAPLALAKQGAGAETLSGPSTYTGGTTLDGGVLELAGVITGAHGLITSGGAGLGAITFGVMGTETLRVDAAAMSGTELFYDLDGFGVGQGVINLHDVTTATHAVFNAGLGVLNVEDAADTVVATLHLGGSFAGDAFAVAANAAGGVDVTVEAAPPPPPPPPPSGGGGGGSPGPDSTFYGTSGADIHVGGTGRDLEYGEGGSDTLTGSQGADTIYAGSGPSGAGANAGDVVYLFGGQGDDLITGGAQGHDAIFGNLGNDHIVTLGSAVSSVYGGQGDDVIDDRAANNFNYLSGDLGNDTIYAGAGFDTVLGGGGDDVIVGSTNAGAGSLQLLFGNQGNDHLSYASAGSVEMFGGQDDDVLSVTTSGQGQTHLLFGNLGADTLTASGGYNSLYGGQGNDVVSAASDTGGHNYLSGDIGNDAVTSSAGGFDTVRGGPGADTITLTAHAAASGDAVVVGADDSTATSATDESNLQHILGFTSGSDHVLLAGHAALTTGAGGNLSTFVGGANASEAAAFSAAYTYAYGDEGANAAHIGATEYLAVQESYGSTTATYLFTADHHVVGLVGVSASGLQTGDVLAG